MSEQASLQNNKPNIEVYAARARENFLQGYNCAQAVVLAFTDLIREQIPDLKDVSDETLLRLASPFGGGLGRMREVCGAVSGSFMVLGLLEGYSNPKAFDEKAELYRKIQKLAADYRAENGSIICRELLIKGTKMGPSAAGPDATGSIPIASDTLSKVPKAGECTSTIIDDAPIPEKRTEEYYKKRPCGDICARTAAIIAEYLFSTENK